MTTPETASPSSRPLLRRLGSVDAVVLGLGSMIGAGVFAAFAPAAQAAGSGLLVGLCVAALVAYANATSSAQLAAQYPTSGGTYIYGRQQLGAWPGFLAGWGFLIGKTASCAAMALTFASYAAPGGWARPLAVAAVIAWATINYFGVTRTALLTKVIVTVVLLALATLVGFAWSSATAHLSMIGLPSVFDAGPYGILQSAGLLFFAFAGYARIATMGEEVRDPERTIPRAILLALAIAVVVYAVVGVTVLASLGPIGTAAEPAPLAAAAELSSSDAIAVIVRIGGAAASLGALLALMAGIGRTTLAMAREGDLPHWLAAVHPRYHVPHHAEVALGLTVATLVIFTDLRGAIGFSSFGVLIYYLIANIAALSQDQEHRLYWKPLQVLGIIGCLVLVATLPWTSIAAGAAVFLIGIGVRVARLGLRHVA